MYFIVKTSVFVYNWNVVGNNKLLLLLETQSSWTVNILIRILLYLAQSYHEYFERTSQSLYKSTKVQNA